jgi:hypothetical protein
MQVAGLFLPEDGTLFQRWLQALGRPACNAAQDPRKSRSLVSILNDVYLKLR